MLLILGESRMNEETITSKQCISVIIVTLISSYLIWLPGIQAGPDVWLSYIIALIWILPFLFIHDSMLKMFPGKDIFDILFLTFGKLVGSVISLLYLCEAFVLGTVVMEDFNEVIIHSSLPETPNLFPVLCITLIIILIAKSGMDIIGKWSEVVIGFMVIALVIAFLALVKDIKLNNLKPILAQGLSPVLQSAISFFSFPLGDVVIFNMVFTKIEYKKQTRIYTTSGILIGGIALMSAIITISVIGARRISETYFPLYVAVQRINIQQYIQRLEILIVGLFILGGVVKIAICALAVSRGITKILNFKSYKFIVTPIAFLLLNAYMLNFKNTMEYIQWDIKVAPRFFTFFQFILPFFVYISVIIKKKLLKNH